jgi:hypothetical protein
MRKVAEVTLALFIIAAIASTAYRLGYEKGTAEEAAHQQFIHAGEETMKHTKNVREILQRLDQPEN